MTQKHRAAIDAINAAADGGPAFPVEVQTYNGMMRGLQTSSHSQWETGMSLRDYFAAKAMPDLMRDVGDRSPFCEVAKMAYEMADAMLAARSNSTGGSDGE
jgi:hypothetical protein